jgi:CDP-6-deoxy-D-xylo-4-hexulose-3-dehydrase
MSMNPSHQFREVELAHAVKSGDLCVLATKKASPGLYVVVSQQEHELECYEVHPVSQLPPDPDFLGLPLAVFGSDAVQVDLRKPIHVRSSEVRPTEITLDNIMLEQLWRALVQRQVARYSEFKFQAQPFVKGETAVPVSGKVLGADELHHLVDASLDGWLTTGRFNKQFEQILAEYIGVRHVLTVNSGSSANLLALTALTSPKLGERALKPGDEVITVAAGFPTTVNPIVQNGLVPVFVDITLPSYNIDVSQLEAALSDKTRAIMMAHTLGNTFNLDVIVQFARERNLWLIEDCCDALGTTYSPSAILSDYRGKDIEAKVPRHVGRFGDIATLSFYPAHHITMGEGGAVYTDNGQLKLILESFRDWGRDCFCEPGQDNTCKKRFSYQLGQLPCGYDHKYTYSHLGYNLKISDMQAAVAVAQMKRLPTFIEQRKAHFSRLHEGLRHLHEFLLLPEAEPNADPSWFGFAITLKQGSRAEFIQHLEQHKIANRLVFGGNLTKQPYFDDVNYRVVGDLAVTDTVMHNSLWIGVFPGLSDSMIDYMIDTICDYFNKRL